MSIGRCLPWRLGGFGYLLFLANRVGAVPPAAEGDARYWDGYHAAPRQLREGDWKKAADGLTETAKLARGTGG